MPALHVKKGDRVYVPGKKQFADVTRDHVLGLEAACVVRTDDGKLRAFAGDEVCQLVDKTTGKDGKGNVTTIPTDVKAVGPSVLANFGVTQLDQQTLFNKFIALEPTVRDEKAAFWEQHQYDDDVLQTFIPEIIQTLQSDDLYIATHVDALLGHVPEEIRASMLANMNERTDSDTRKGLIIRYTLIQNDRLEVERFRQQLFAMLTDTSSYTRIEMERSLLLTKEVQRAEAEQRVKNFVETAPQDAIDQFAADWRASMYYTRAARKSGTRRVLKRLMKHEVATGYESVSENASA